MLQCKANNLSLLESKGAPNRAWFNVQIEWRRKQQNRGAPPAQDTSLHRLQQRKYQTKFRSGSIFKINFNFSLSTREGAQQAVRGLTAKVMFSLLRSHRHSIHENRHSGFRFKRGLQDHGRIEIPAADLCFPPGTNTPMAC